MMKRSEIFFSLLSVPVDFFALLLGFVAAYHLRDSFNIVFPSTLDQALSLQVGYGPISALEPFQNYLHYILYIIPGMLLIFALVGLYGMRSATPWPRRFIQILIGVSVGEFFILLLFVLKKDFFLPRSTILYSWILCTVFVTVARYGIRLVQKLLYRYNIGVIRVAIIGRSDAAKLIMRNLSARPNSTYRLVKRFDGSSIENIIPQIEQDRFDELIVVSETYEKEDLIVLRNYCLERHIGFSFVPAIFGAMQSSYAIRSEVGLPMIEIQPTPLEGWGRVVKRVFDIIVSVVLIILFSPVFLVIAAWLKISSPGPLIYKQKRIGKNKEHIYVWKFRSMLIEYCTGLGYDGDTYFQKLLKTNPDLATEWEANHKLKNDPRISAPGKFLRKSSLDELPQFFNVLGGSLSLVGPRPIVDEEVVKYGEAARILFTVKPGATGSWQVSGRSDVDYKERIALDAEYIEHWNLWRDIVILVKTPLKMFKRDGGAY